MSITRREQLRVLATLYEMEAQLKILQGVQEEKRQEIRRRIQRMERMLEFDKALAERRESSED